MQGRLLNNISIETQIFKFKREKMQKMHRLEGMTNTLTKILYTFKTCKGYFSVVLEVFSVGKIAKKSESLIRKFVGSMC